MTKQQLGQSAEQVKKRQIGKNRRGRIVSVLACVVVFCVTYALILPALTWERSLICDTKEHTHTDECYATQTVAAERTLCCDMAEHTHTDACYTDAQVLTCGMEEAQGHTHTEACYNEAGELTCGTEEAAGHTHTEACYTVQRTLCCTQAEHSHTEACCHTTEAREETVLVCSLQEHIHTEACYDAPPAEETVACGNLSADLETADSWEAAIKNLSLTGSRAEDVLLIAASQLGVTESKTNYIVTADGTIKGYSRYGAWYGSPYGDWCAMFCAFCLHYAGVTDMPLSASCPQWVQLLQAEGRYRSADTYIPQPGDLIFFDYEPNGVPNHVGLVCTADEGGIQTIEGNTSAGVAYRSYALHDAAIMGYGCLDTAPVTVKKAAVRAAEQAVVRPTYPDYITPSAAKQGSRTDGDLAVSYASDPATSDLETHFTGRKADDGKVLADKSVIYEADDYGVFDTYSEDTFGVSLSVLGQEYAITEDFDVATPLDVVFILDASGSMIETVNGGQTSANIMIESLNDIMYTILQANEDNRVGVVCFSGSGTKLLELGHYTAQNHQYFEEGRCTSKDYVLTPGSTIQRTDGTLYKGRFTAGWWGTYTQHGIATGAQLFLDNDDTTVTKTVSRQTPEGPIRVTYTAKRRPIIILLSDGDPTYCTEDYADVLSSRNIHGSGNSGFDNRHYAIEETTNNNKGINGYYTILSAQSYKNQVAAHYQTDAYFYTVGIGMYQSGTNSYSMSVTGDDYKRAVLNPDAAEISALQHCTNGRTDSSLVTVPAQRDISDYTDMTCHMLYRLLHNTYPYDSVRIENYTHDQAVTYGMPADTTPVVPVAANPYTNYAYADDAFFTTQTTVEELTQAFAAAIGKFSDSFPVYGFLLRQNQPIVVTDYIGDGMELKSEPILRYGGENHAPVSHETVGSTTTYRYAGSYTATDGSNKYVDLSGITAEVITEASGLQTVRFLVPDAQLPTYLPNIDVNGETNFYYEALPARLIYQVGLTDEAETEVAALKETGGTLCYVTNRWSDGVSADTEYAPTDTDPYYSANTYDRSSTPKTENPTDTADTAWSYGARSDNRFVQELLGNNGKLTYTVEAVTTSVSVIKKWEGGEEASVQVELLQNGAPYGEPVTLNADNHWYHCWSKLPKTDETGDIDYAVRELVPDGYEMQLHLWTGEGDPYGQTETEQWLPHSVPEDGGIYLLTFEDYWDESTNYGTAVLGANEAHTGLVKLDYQSLGEITDDLLWRVSVANGKYTFTNLGAERQLVLDNNNRIALGAADNCHISAWTWRLEEHGYTLLGQYQSRTRTYTYEFQVTTLTNGVGDASAKGYYVPLTPYACERTVTEDEVEKGAAHYILINRKTEREPTYVLPETGAGGCLPYVLCGSLLLGLSALGLALQVRKKRQSCLSSIKS